MKDLKNNKGIGLVPFILIFVAILVIAGVTVGVVIITKNFNKQQLSVSEFKNIMENKDFEIVDAKDQFEAIDYIEKVYIALEEDYDYQIEFYRFDEEDSAIDFYKTNKKIFEATKGTSSAETSANMGNNSKYTLTTNDEYKVVSRIENTVIYANVDDKYKDEVKDLLKELGY